MIIWNSNGKQTKKGFEKMLVQIQTRLKQKYWNIACELVGQLGEYARR